MRTTSYANAALSAFRRGYRDFLYRRSVSRTLESLDDRILADLGISRGEIATLVAGATQKSGPPFSGKSPSHLHVALKQRSRISATSEVQGECCSP